MPNPANTRVRVGFEANEGFGNPAVWQDIRIRSEGLGAEFPVIEDDSILANAEQAEGLETKIDPSGPVNVNYSPEDHAKIIACFFGKGATPVQAPTGVYTHKLAVTETAVDFLDTMAIEVSRDLGRPDLYKGVIPTSMSFQAGPRGLVNGSIDMLIPRFDHFALPAILALTPPLTNSYLRGMLDYAALAAGTAVDVKITTAPTTTMGIKAKLSTAGTYDGAEIVVAAGTWYDLKHLVGDVQLGSDDLPVQIMFTNLTGFLINQELRYASVRTVWSQVLPVASPLNEVLCTIKVDGVTFRTREFNLTATQPGERDEAIGGRFIDQVVRFGQRTFSGQLNRRALDLSAINRLIRAKVFEIRIDALGTFIAATGVRRKMSWIAKNCKPSGRSPSVGGLAQFDEAIDFTAHPSTDGTYPSALTIELVNSQASLAT